MSEQEVQPTVSVEHFDALRKHVEAIAERIGALEKIVGGLVTAPKSGGDTVDVGARKAIAHVAGHLSNDGTDIVGCVTNILEGKPPREVPADPAPAPATTTETPTA